MSVSYYDYFELRAKARKGNKVDIDAFGEWFQQYGLSFWNGEYFDADGLRLFPVYEQHGEDDFEIIGYEFR